MKLIDLQEAKRQRHSDYVAWVELTKSKLKEDGASITARRDGFDIPLDQFDNVVDQLTAYYGKPDYEEKSSGAKTRMWNLDHSDQYGFELNVWEQNNWVNQSENYSNINLVRWDNHRDLDRPRSHDWWDND